MTKIVTHSDATVLGIQDYHAALFLIYDGATASLRPVEWHQSQDHEMTFDVYHRRTLEWATANVSAAVADAGLIRGLAEKLQPLLDRVAAGFAVGWDGSNNVGTLTEDAQAASEEITETMDRLHPEDWAAPVDVWDAREWLGDYHDVTADTTDAEIAAAAQQFLDVAASDNIHLTFNRGETMADILASIRDEATEARAEEEAE